MKRLFFDLISQTDPLITKGQEYFPVWKCYFHGISILFFLYENHKKFETVEFRSRKLSSFQKKSSKIEPFWIISKLSTDNRHKKWWFCISLGFPRSPRPPKLFTNHFCGLSTVVKCNPDQFTKDMLHQIKQTISILVVSQQCKTLYWSNYQ